ncbi:efflux RND transporter permease subunit, partial [Vibrio sp. 977]|uniref:efflux RND transporter permease subunit n=1 Tax=Vibrio sp. 977 TaxID=3074621 RepID=UPI002964E455
GAEFFPEVDTPFFTVKVRSYGDLSINEKDIVMREIEKVMLGHDEFESVYTRTGSSDNGDEIGQIQITPVDWQYRRKVKTIIEELKATTDQFYGVELEYKFPDAGPPVEHDLVIEVSSRSRSIGELDDAAKLVRLWADSNPALTNLSDTTNKEGIDWQIDIRRDDASRFAADATLVGNTVQFVTNGLKIGDYLPDDADEEVDILVRYPQEKRDIGRFDQLRVKTAAGLVPITNFAQIK